MADTRTIMVVGGGAWQVPLITKAKHLGHRVINSNPHEDSPGFEVADVGRVADVLDRAANLAIAREFEPDAIVTDQSDIAVPTVAYLCETLGLPGIGSATAKRFTDKSLMRACCRDHDFPHPRFKVCRNLSELQDFFDRGEGSVVIKPTNNQGSRGVVRVDARGDLAPAWEATLAFCCDGQVLAEDYVGGIELTVEGVKLPDRHLTLAVSVKGHYAHNPMVARRLLYAPRHPEFDHDELAFQHDRFIEVMGLSFGITHTEYKYFDGRFYLVETAARGGGTRISSDILPLFSGIDANALLLRMALGEDPGSVEPQVGSRHVVLEFFNFEPGLVAAIEGLEIANRMPGVHELGLTFAVGDILQPPRDDRSRHMHLIAFAESRDALEALVDRVHQTITVRYG